MRDSSTVFYFGHGSEEGDAWISADGEIRFADAENIEAAKGRMVIAMACFSGAKLAGIAVALGVRTYVGFSRRVFTIENSSEFASAGANAISVLFGDVATAAQFAQALERNFIQLRDHYRGPGRGLPNSTLHWVAADHNTVGIVPPEYSGIPLVQYFYFQW